MRITLFGASASGEQVYQYNCDLGIGEQESLRIAKSILDKQPHVHSVVAIMTVVNSYQVQGGFHITYNPQLLFVEKRGE